MTKITLLDGGLGEELVKLSGSEPTPLWCAAVMREQPHLVRQVHNCFFAAGAKIATTNTYAVLPDRLEHAGLLDQLVPLTKAAIQVATQARDAHGSGRVAGSIGPLFGSYRPEHCPPPEEAAEYYKESVALMAPHVDLFLIETMSSINQAEGALRACLPTGKPLWLSMTVMDDDGSRLRSGEPLANLAPLVTSYQPQAVLVNCSPPEVISTALEVISTFGKPFGAYANGFTHITKEYKVANATVNALQARTDLSPTEYADYCMEWINGGATIVGGCCEIGPAHIKQVARRIQKSGHEIA